METKTAYKGITTIVSDLLFEPIKKVIEPPRKSNKFGSKSLYYKGVYYFFECIIDNEVQGVFYSGKWVQDTFYIDIEFKEFLLSYSF